MEHLRRLKLKWEELQKHGVEQVFSMTAFNQEDMLFVTMNRKGVLGGSVVETTV